MARRLLCFVDWDIGLARRQACLGTTYTLRVGAEGQLPDDPNDKGGNEDQQEV